MEVARTCNDFQSRFDPEDVSGRPLRGESRSSFLESRLLLPSADDVRVRSPSRPLRAGDLFRSSLGRCLSTDDERLESGSDARLLDLGLLASSVGCLSTGRELLGGLGKFIPLDEEVVP